MTSIKERKQEEQSEEQSWKQQRRNQGETAREIFEQLKKRQKVPGGPGEKIGTWLGLRTQGSRHQSGKCHQRNEDEQEENRILKQLFGIETIGPTCFAGYEMARLPQHA